VTVQERRRPPRVEPEPDAEQEIDLGRYWTTIATRWWLPLLGLVAGAIVGYLISLSGSTVFRAQATVYMGQPLGIQGGNQVQGPNTNPSTARAIVKAEATLQKVARDVGLPVSTLRNGVSANPVQGNLSKLGQTPLIAVTVKGPKRVKVRQATNELAQLLVARLAGYSKLKIGTFTREIQADQASVDQINAALSASSITPLEKLVLQLRLTQVQNDLTTAIQLRSLAQQVEAPRIISHAAAQKTTARSRRNSLVVGALIGLLLGIAAALVVDRVPARRHAL
jgi:uncharacterized protein involved in exopolysaccharide biosynthesis